MTPNEIKQFLHSILTNWSLTIDAKFQEITKHFPDYLNDTTIKKSIYEKLEWFFHDWLGTYFEELVYNKTNEHFQLWQNPADTRVSRNKMNNAILLYKKLFPGNEYRVDRNNEIENIELWSWLALNTIIKKIWNNGITSVTHSAQEFRQGNARDIYIEINDWSHINFSLKVDKSWKAALFEWQTRAIQDKVYKRYFNLSDESYEKLKQELFKTTDEKIIFEDFQNVALLTQTVIIQQLWLENASINNLLHARVTNIDNMKYCIKQLKYYKKSNDNSHIIVVNRLSWLLGSWALLDDIDENHINSWDFSFTECKPKKDPYWIEPTIKYKWYAFVSFQVKKQRGSRTSQKFTDITIRLRNKK